MACRVVRGFVRVAGGGLLLVGVVFGGCVTVSETTTVTAGATTAGGNPRRSAPRRPAGLVPERMVLSTAGTRDTDANGYPDTILVIAYLFGDASKYELPIRHPGEFAFRVTTQEGDWVGQWNFDERQTADSAQDFFPGPGYAFGLRLREGLDKRAKTDAVVQGRYRDAKSQQEVRASGAAEVVLGTGGGPPAGSM
jgi:hypothetical protein